MTTPTPTALRGQTLRGSSVLREALRELGPLAPTLDAPGLRRYRSMSTLTLELASARGSLGTVAGVVGESTPWYVRTMADADAELEASVIAAEAGWERENLAALGALDEEILTLRGVHVDARATGGARATCNLGVSSASAYLAASAHWEQLSEEARHRLGWGCLTAGVVGEGVYLPGLPPHLSHGIGVDAIAITSDGYALLARRPDATAPEHGALAPAVSGWARPSDLRGSTWHPEHTLERICWELGVAYTPQGTHPCSWTGVRTSLHDGSSSVSAVVHTGMTLSEIEKRWRGEELIATAWDADAVRRCILTWRGSWLPWTLPALTGAAAASMDAAGAAGVRWACQQRPVLGSESTLWARRTSTPTPTLARNLAHAGQSWS